HAIAIAGYDHGDAPASYGDAAHLVVPSTTLYLGACVDTEAASQPGVDADLDDANAGTSRVGVCADDEDGITFASPLAACQPALVEIRANAAGRLDAWIDYDRDGDFDDAGEQVFAAQPVVAGTNALAFDVPCSANPGASHARLRLTSAG